MMRLILERPGASPVLMVFDRETVVVGRGVADWPLPFPDVSRQQCRFVRRGDRVDVEGLSATNPTHVNGCAIAERTRIGAGDRVSFGHCVVRLAGEAPRAAAPAGPREEAPRASDPEHVLEDMSIVVEKARRWADGGQAPRLLSRGADLACGRVWLRGGRDLGADGALVRRHVEASLWARRAELQRRTALAGAVALALVGGAATGRAVVGELAWEAEARAVRGPARGCAAADLERAEGVLAAAEREADATTGLLFAGHALRIAGRVGCRDASRAEAAVREKLTARRSWTLGVQPGPVRAIAARPDGRLVATVDARGRVRVWDLYGGGAAYALDEGRGAAEVVAFSGDGRWLAAGSAAGEVLVWDVRRGPQAVLRGRLDAGRAAITALALDGAAGLLATGDARGAVRLWDMSEGSFGRALGVDEGAAGGPVVLAFAGGGERLHGLAGGRVRSWRVEASGPSRRLGAAVTLPAAGVTTVDVRGEEVVTGDRSGAVTVWRAARGRWTGRQVARHEGAVVRVRALADAVVSLGGDRRLLLADRGAPLRRDGTPMVYAFAVSAAADLVVDGSGGRASTVGEGLQVWDLVRRREGPVVATDEQSGAVTAAAAAGSWVMTGGADGSVRAWDLRQDGGGAGAHVLPDSPPLTLALAFAGQGSAAAAAGSDGSVRAWRVDADGVPALHATWKEAAERVALSDDGRWLAGAAGPSIRVWDLEDVGRAPVVLAGHVEAVRELKFGGRGAWLVSADLGGEVHFWRIGATGPEAGSRRMALPQGVWALATSGEHVAVGTGASDDASGRTYVWELGEAWSEGALLAAHTRPVTALAFAASGAEVASGSADGGVRAAAWVEGRWQATRPYDHGLGVRALAFGGGAEGAASLAVGGLGGAVTVYEPRTGGEGRRFAAHAGAVTGLAFGADPSRLLTASQDGELSLWLLAGGERELALLGHRGAVVELHADLGGRMAVSAGDDATIRVWPLEPEGLVRLSCLVAGREPGPDAWARVLPGHRPEALCSGRDAGP